MAKNMAMQGVTFFAAGFGIKRYTHAGNGVLEASQLGSVETYAQHKLRHSGKITNLRCYIEGGRFGNTLNAATTLKLRLNGASALSLTIPAATSGAFENTTGSAAPNTGDLASIEWDMTAPTAGNAKMRTISVMHDAGGNNMYTQMCNGYNNSVVAPTPSTTSFIHCIGSCQGEQTDEARSTLEVTHAACDWKGLGWYVHLNTRSSC